MILYFVKLFLLFMINFVNMLYEVESYFLVMSNWAG